MEKGENSPGYLLLHMTSIFNAREAAERKRKRPKKGRLDGKLLLNSLKSMVRRTQRKEK